MQEKGGLELVQQALRRFSDDPLVCELGCGAVLSLCDTAEKRRMFSGAEDIDLIFSILQRHSEEGAVCAEALGALQMLASEEGNAEILASRDVVKHVIVTLKRHTERLLVAEFGSGALHHLSFNNAKSQQEILVLGGASFLATFLNNYQQRSSVACENILGVLSNIASDGEAANTLLSAELPSGSIIDIVLATVKINMLHAGVVEKGARALWSLTIKSPDAKKLVVNGGGASILVSALLQHSSDTVTLGAICGAMIVLASDSEGNQCLRDLNTHEAAASLLAKTEPGQPSVFLQKLSDATKPSLSRHSSIVAIAREDSKKEEIGRR